MAAAGGGEVGAGGWGAGGEVVALSWVLSRQISGSFGAVLCELGPAFPDASRILQSLWRSIPLNPWAVAGVGQSSNCGRPPDKVSLGLEDLCHSDNGGKSLFGTMDRGAGFHKRQK